MALYEIDFSWHLSDDQFIDIFIIQWHTPILTECSSIDAATASAKAALLKDFSDWLIRFFHPNTPKRPLFIVTPELSTPKNCSPLIENIVKSLDRPTVFIAGREYLTWDEYKNDIGNSDMPEKSEWLQGGNNNLFVNAAGIWMKDGSNVKKFIQSKSHPYVEELSKIYPNNNILLFKSKDETPGKKINFSIQICSDFTSDEKVKNFRGVLVSGSCKTHSLDITFLLQCQDNQETDQFKKAAETYFKPANSMIETGNGCLVFINNANEVHGKQSLWGKSKFHFKFADRYSAPMKEAQPTYAAKIHDTFNHQEISFRERGAGIYQLTYKPHYLKDLSPGAGEQMPFQGQPCFALIQGNRFPTGKDEEKFHPIHPFIYWLNNEWLEGQSLISSFSGQGYQAQAITEFLQEYKKDLEKWLQHIGNSNRTARNVIGTYFLCFGNEIKYPFQSPEPEDWHPNSCEAIKKFLMVYTLINFAGRKLSQQIRPDVSEDRHAVSEDYFSTFLSGGGKKSVCTLLSKFLSITDKIAFVRIKKKRLFIIVEASDISNAGQVFSELASFSQLQYPPEGISTVPSMGDLVTGESWATDWGIIHSINLMTDFKQAKNQDELMARTVETLKGCWT